MNLLLNKLIEEGEHQQQDFKFCINDSKKIAKSLVAFANTDGGRLLIGVKDNGKIAGIRTDEEFYMVEAAARIYSMPPVEFITKEWHSEGKIVLEINVLPSEKKPHFARDDSGKWLAYIRVHDENVLAHKIQLEVWKKQKSPKGICFSYSSDEKLLIDYLRTHESISFNRFMRLARLTRRKTADILSNFIIMDILEMNNSGTGTLFKLKAGLDNTELDKFK